jgi:diacylglycerol kinase (ATP)
MKGSPRALVILNPGARGGTAPERFARVRPAIEARYHIQVVETDRRGGLRAHLEAALRDGVRLILGAGGDGTVNAVVSALVELKEGGLGGATVGAVGLGSSNDFHKPVGCEVAGIPLRIEAATATARDVVRVTYENDSGRHRGIFIVSASVGVVASANRFFNEGDPLLRGLKRRFTDAAILYAAIRTVAGHGGHAATLRLEDEERSFQIANLSVMKSPHLAGGLTYDTPVDPASGLFAVNLMEHRGRLATLSAMSHLQKGRFRGRPGAHHWNGSRLEVMLPTEGDLELDGEVVRVRRVTFEVLPQRIRVCA